MIRTSSRLLQLSFITPSKPPALTLKCVYIDIQGVFKLVRARLPMMWLSQNLPCHNTACFGCKVKVFCLETTVEYPLVDAIFKQKEMPI